MFYCFQINLKDCENSLVWWVTRENQFLHVNYLTHQILGIIKYLIEIKRIFLNVGVITNL
jgi:hypothetical protein